jgi:hypothetical protein
MYCPANGMLSNCLSLSGSNQLTFSGSLTLAKQANINMVIVNGSVIYNCQSVLDPIFTGPTSNCNKPYYLSYIILNKGWSCSVSKLGVNLQSAQMTVDEVNLLNVIKDPSQWWTFGEVKGYNGANLIGDSLNCIGDDGVIKENC